MAKLLSTSRSVGSMWIRLSPPDHTALAMIRLTHQCHITRSEKVFACALNIITPGRFRAFQAIVSRPNRTIKC
jgi:hypothetical protein